MKNTEATDSKIYVYLDDEVQNGESLWAVQTEDYYRIKSVPFFVYGISYDDLVEAELQDGILVYKRKVRDSGHSTYRVFCKDPSYEKFDFFWGVLESMGCTYEKGTTDLYSIDVPPDSNVYEVYAILELGEKKGAWEFEEGHCGHPLIKSTT